MTLAGSFKGSGGMLTGSGDRERKKGTVPAYPVKAGCSRRTVAGRRHRGSIRSHGIALKLGLFVVQIVV